MIGYDTFSCAGLRWRRVHGAVIPHEMPHVGVDVSSEEARKVRAQSSSLLVRWNNGFDLPDATDWWYVIKDSDPELSRLSKKVRYQVRQGLKAFSVRRCERAVILDAGYPVYVAAFERYETFEPVYTRAQFESAIRSMPDEIEFWGVFEIEGGQLCAFAENIVDSGACFYSTMWFTSPSLKRFAAYALVQTMNEEYLGSRKLAYVSDGARNLSHQTNVHQFLQEKFGFRRAYSRLGVVYSPLVGFLVALLYPLRTMLGSWGPMSRLQVLLEQERIRRECVVGPT